MDNFGGALGNADFGEPASVDTTSAPSFPDTSQATPQQQLSPLASAIARSKSKKQQKPKQPATLAAAIARARSARPSARKFG